MRSLLRKIRSVLEERGPHGLLVFLGTRLVRVRRHVVFRRLRPRDATLQPQPETPRGCRLLVAADSEDLAHLALPEQQRNIREYLHAVAKGDAVGVFVRVGEELVHHAFLMRRSRMLDILGASEGSMLLGNAYTDPRFRGRGYQKLSIRARLAMAWKLGAKAVVSETDPDNVASMRALESAGLERVGRMTVAVVGNRLVFRIVEGDWGAGRLGWCGGGDR